MARRGKRAVSRAQVNPAVDADIPAPAEVAAPVDPVTEPVPAPLEDVPLDPFAPVSVRNTGTRDWSGSDFKAVGNGWVKAGAVGVVTRKKAEDLLAGRHWGVELGVGPFEIVGD